MALADPTILAILRATVILTIACSQQMRAQSGNTTEPVTAHPGDLWTDTNADVATTPSSAMLQTTEEILYTRATYVVVAPQTVRPGDAYNISVTILNSTGDVSFNASLHSPMTDTAVAASHTVIHSNDFHNVVTIQVPDSPSESYYTLHVSATGGLDFYNMRTVYVARQLSIFIQTDKSVYNPSERVMFRAIVVNPDLKPYKGNVSFVTIQDSEHNVIMQWFDQNCRNGVFNNSLQLPPAPQLGTWTVRVLAKGTSYEKTFLVTKYKPAAFAVDIQLPPVYYVNDRQFDQQFSKQDDFKFSIDARLHGTQQPVNGIAHVNITVRDVWYNWGNMDVRTISNKTEILLDVQLVSGKASVTISATSLRDIVPFYNYWNFDYILNNTNNAWSYLARDRIAVGVSATESVTGEVVSTNRSVPCSPDYGNYSLTFLDNSTRVVKPGLPSVWTVRMSRHDGKQLVSEDVAGRQLVVHGSCNNGNSNWFNIEFSSALSLTGLVSFSRQVQCKENAFLGAYLRNSTSGSNIASSQGSWNMDGFYTRDNEALQISLVTPTDIIAAGCTVVFRLLSTRNTTTFFYQLLGKGIHVKSGRLTFALSTSHDFSIPVDTQLASKLSPAGQLVVWYITESGEIISERLDFSVAVVFTNQVTATFSATSVQTGDTVTVTVSAHPGSYVGLLAVDQAALSVPGNDITTDTILLDLTRYHKESRCHNSYRRKKRDVATSESGGRSSAAVFNAAGVIASTDAFIYDYYRFYCDDQPYSSPSPSSDPSQNVFEGLTSIPNSLETWLWADVTTNADGRATMQVTVPDHVTSWMLTAFAISPEAGLAVVSQPANLTATRQFYLTIRAPFSVIRGEEFGLQVTVFNHGSTAALASITLQKSELFKVRTPNSAEPHDSAVQTSVEVPAVGSSIVNLWLVSKNLGLITVYVEGAMGHANYTATTQFLVQPEGVAQEYADSVLVDPSSTTSFNHTFVITLPAKLVAESQRIVVNAVGDVMGQSLDGLGNLLHMPYGCGEQNMLNFAPDVYILKYLRTVGKSTPDVEAKALQYIVDGYRRELTYQRTDGSFSAFGNWDHSGSVWLTAFVAKCFHEAKEFLQPDEHNIAISLSWLLIYQQTNGIFTDPGRVIHWDMQGGSSGGEPLTAYVLISLLENLENTELAAMNGSDVQSKVDLSASYLESRLDNVKTNSYALNIICYALQLSNSSAIDKCLQYLNALAVNNDGQMYWEKSTTGCRYDCSPRAVDVEMTAYGLLTYTKRKDRVKAASISKWIIAQRNGNGGFISTQDTVVALQALAEYAQLMAGGSSGQNGLTISLRSGSWTHLFDTLTSTNAIVLQSADVPSEVDYVTVEATGGGVFGIVQLIVKYYVYVDNTIVPGGRRKREAQGSSSSLISIRTDQKQITDNEVILVACANYSGTEQSGMCIMEVTMPTGYAAIEPEQLRGQANGNVKKVEVDQDNNKLVLYLDELISTETCVNMSLERVMAVSNAQPAKVTAYLYYNPAVKSIHEYRSLADTGKTWCDQCPTCCVCSSLDYFECDGKCLDKSVKCNGISECSDRQDEAGCSALVLEESTTEFQTTAGPTAGTTARPSNGAVRQSKADVTGFLLLLLVMFATCN